MGPNQGITLGPNLNDGESYWASNTVVRLRPCCIRIQIPPMMSALAAVI